MRSCSNNDYSRDKWRTSVVRYKAFVNKVDSRVIRWRAKRINIINDTDTVILRGYTGGATQQDFYETFLKEK